MEGYPYRHFYLFKGNWLDRFDQLIQKNKTQKFELWEPKNKSRKLHLLILFGKPLSDTFCLVKKVFQTDEDTFLCFFQPCIKEFHVHKFGDVNIGEIENYVNDEPPEKPPEYLPGQPAADRQHEMWLLDLHDGV